VLSLKERDFRAAGHRGRLFKRTIMRKHILPNVLNRPILLGTSCWRGHRDGAALSFLGVGVPPPPARLGSHAGDGKKGLMAGYWWLTVLPGC